MPIASLHILEHQRMRGYNFRKPATACCGAIILVIERERKWRWYFQQRCPSMPVIMKHFLREILLWLKKRNLVAILRSIARCNCGNKMRVKESFIIGMVMSYVAQCCQCNDSKIMKTSQEGVKNAGGSKDVATTHYDLHTKLVKKSFTVT